MARTGRCLGSLKLRGLQGSPLQEPCDVECSHLLPVPILLRALVQQPVEPLVAGIQEFQHVVRRIAQGLLARDPAGIIEADIADITAV